MIKRAVDLLSPSIAKLIDKSIKNRKFPSQLKMSKVFPVFKLVQSLIHPIIGQYQFSQLYLNV